MFDEFARRRHAGTRGAEERKEEFNFYKKRIETFNSVVFVRLKFQQICVLLVAKLKHAARVRADINFARYINGVQVNGTGTCTCNLSLT